MAADDVGLREFVSTRLDGLRRTAYLLSGDWHQADDLVSTALVKLLRHWGRVRGMDNPDAYVRRMLLRAWLDERRRPWRRERTTARLPDAAAPDDDPARRLAIMDRLADLPPRRRAVLVLRFFCDLSVEDTAMVLGVSEGTVKSQTARALQTLRTSMDITVMGE